MDGSPAGQRPVLGADAVRSRAGAITVPVLLVGGWQDLFIEQTLEQYRTLAGRGVPVRLLVGPWAHLDLTSQGSVAINESLAWLDRYAAPGRTDARPAAPPDHPVRVRSEERRVGEGCSAR